MTRPTIIAGNWKLNPTRAEGERLYKEILAGVEARALPEHAHVLVFPPWPFLGLLAPSERVRIGAQNVSVEGWGPYTGEVGAELLEGFGIGHVIVGHSERRRQFGEDDEAVARKAQAVLRAGLMPVLCVGETAEERAAGQTFRVLEAQIAKVLGRIGSAPVPLILAYEPVWAIGTGRNATPEQAREAHEFLRKQIGSVWSPAAAERVPILYGGSVTPANAGELFRQPGIDGALVGGASLKAELFLSILDEALRGR